MDQRISASVVVVLLVGACAGTSSGNPASGVHPGPPEFCQTETRALTDRDAVTELGFSAADVSALALGSHRSTLQWLEDDGYPFGPEHGTTSLDIDVSERAAPRLLVRTDARAGVPSGSECKSRIEADLRVKLRSSGGALDETIDVTLRAERAEEAAFGYGQVDPEVLRGKLTLASSDKAKHFYGWLCHMTFTKDEVAGRLEVVVERETGNAAEGKVIVLARWPAE